MRIVDIDKLQVNSVPNEPNKHMISNASCGLCIKVRCNKSPTILDSPDFFNNI